jgi:hypothetical protein
MAERGTHETFWEDDPHQVANGQIDRESPTKQDQAVHIGQQNGGVFSKVDSEVDDSYSYTSSRRGLKLRNAQGSTASLASLDDTEDGQASFYAANPLSSGSQQRAYRWLSYYIGFPLLCHRGVVTPAYVAGYAEHQCQQ